jgi:peptide/nickel transport system substrate-binding protein
MGALFGISRRNLALSALAAASVLCLSAPAGAQSSGSTIKLVPQADLRSIDPIWTTAYITRNYGYMVYDTLLATDEHFKVQPQMVETWTVSEDGLVYAFTLRPGLKWHDGAPVTAADCIASLDRWMKRDVLGQALPGVIGEMKAVDATSFTITLKKPFALFLDALAKISSNTPFMMPERVAKTDANTQIKESIGSGPFKFAASEWVPGSKAVFVKNTDYVPRKEPASWAAGGKVVKVDRVEWQTIPDSQTAANALNAGEVDWWELVPQDLAPLLAKNKDVTVTTTDPLGNMGVLRFNHEQPPFNNVKMRQAVQMLVDQKNYMTAVAGDQKYWKACYSFFPCGTPMSSDAGSEALSGPRDLEKAKALVKEAGYAGEPVVVMAATDQPIVYAQALVTMEILKQLGINADLQAMDWGTLITRRASHEPVDKGGWNIFFTWSAAPDLLNPAVHSQLRGNGAKAWFGWPTNAKIEALRDQWFEAPSLAAQQKIAAEIQAEAFQAVPHIHTGQFVIPTAFRNSLKGVIVAPVLFMWNVEKG